MADVQPATHAGLTWEEVCADPRLDDLPYKIEPNEWEQIVMSPRQLRRGALSVRIARLLDDVLREGRIITDAAIRTTKGTKVADVAWFSAERWAQVQDEFDASIAPEICVEIISPTNAPGEIEQKKQLYFDAGAQEVWLCDLDGQLQFFTAGEKLATSALVPDVPERVDLD